MEPTLATASHLIAVLEELKRREPLFHRPELDEGTWQTRAPCSTRKR